VLIFRSDSDAGDYPVAVDATRILTGGSSHSPYTRSVQTPHKYFVKKKKKIKWLSFYDS
jgi:hypothetical protein